jgi:hypothetical protein
MAEKTPAQKTPAQKMLLKPGATAALLHVPAGILPVLGVADGASVQDYPAGAGFILEFATTQDEAEERLAALKPHVGAATVAWLAYPKGSRAAGHDLNRDTIWKYAATIGLVLVTNVSIDDTWSALRVRPA